MSIVSSQTYTCVRDSKSRAHFFNPGYEASVALGDRSYTPPGMVQAMRRDLWELPYYYADEKDIVLNPHDLPPAEELSGYDLYPWGWAPELSYGKLSTLVPYTYEEMRQWSSRHNTYLLLSSLIRLYPEYYSRSILPQVITPSSITPEVITSDRYVLKEEFSSSGRGVVFVEGAEVASLILRRQNKSASKRLYLEPLHDKISDRGYEFVRRHDGKVVYVGPSDFSTTEGRYTSNRIVSPEIIHNAWKAMPTHIDHDTYVQHLSRALEDLPLGRYCGPIGVDTIVYKERGRLYLHPCIEVNVRPTMGWLALALGEKYISESTVGTFELIHFPSPEALRRDLTPTLSSPTALYRREHTAQKPGVGRHLLSTLMPESRFAAILTISSMR